MAASMRGSVVARQNHCDRSLGMDGQTRSSDQRQTNARQRNNADTVLHSYDIRTKNENRIFVLRVFRTEHTVSESQSTMPVVSSSSNLQSDDDDDDHDGFLHHHVTT